MGITEILKNTDHRPFEIPTGDWKFYQEWNNVIFLHWKVDERDLGPFVPKELIIDTFDGSAWVSLVAFTMEKVRPKNIPAFSPISNFDEINIRTYVKAENKQGVYFLSIEGGKRLSCLIAKKVSQLPYRYSEMERCNSDFSSRNSERKDLFEAKYKIGKEITSKTLMDVWLTERYSLFQDYGDCINEFDIHHLEWPLQEIEFEDLVIAYPKYSKLITTQPIMAHYSSGVQVLAWGKKKKRKSELKNS